MDQNLSIANAMLPRITQENSANPLAASELLLDAAGPLQIVYAPFDYVEARAKLVVVGITPGMTQTVNALIAALKATRSGLSTEACLASAKLTASFSGAPSVRDVVRCSTFL